MTTAFKEGPPVAGTAEPRWRYNLLTSLALITPLFLTYQIGVLLTWPIYNGADLITVFLVHHLRLIGYLALNIAVAVCFIAMAASRKGHEGVKFGMMVPLLLESALYAFFLGTAIIFVMHRVFHLVPPHMAEGPVAERGPMTAFVMSAGAGVHEELLFRLVLMNGLVLLFKGMKFGATESFMSALLFSSTLFSAVHHLGPLGDPFSIWVFTFRLLAGFAFGTIYWFRGFAVAVYTHALYDMYVLLVR